jgi:hypothetical protein
MIRQRIVENAYGVHVMGNQEFAMFPGKWVETWALMAGTGVWMLIGFEPLPAEKEIV